MEINSNPTTTADKFDTIKALAIELGWTDLAEHEAAMETASRMWNRGKITDALQAYLDEDRATKGLAPRAECTQRISFRDPKHPKINFHVQLLDGKIESAALNYFNRKPVTSLTGILRYLFSELEMQEIREQVRLMTAELRKTGQRVGSGDHPVWEVLIDGEPIGKCWRRIGGTAGYYGAWVYVSIGGPQRWTDSRQSCVNEIMWTVGMIRLAADEAAEAAYHSQNYSLADCALADRLYEAGRNGNSLTLTADQVEEISAWLDASDEYDGSLDDKLTRVMKCD